MIIMSGRFGAWRYTDQADRAGVWVVYNAVQLRKSMQKEEGHPRVLGQDKFKPPCIWKNAIGRVADSDLFFLKIK